MAIRVKLEEKERERSDANVKIMESQKQLEENKCDSFYNFGVGGNLSMIHI